MSRRWSRVAVCALALAACGESGGGPGEVAIRVDSVQVAANPHNVISAVVRFYGTGDSARVRYRLTGAAEDSITPATPITGPLPIRLLALGLLPASAYEIQVEVFGEDGSELTPATPFATGVLPGDLPEYSASGPDPLPGYTVFSHDPYGIVIDNTGRVVWYRKVGTTGPGLNFMVVQSGEYVGRPLSGGGANASVFVLFDAAGDSVRTLGCQNGLPVRFHDVLVQPDGSYWIMCDDRRTVDMSAYGGSATASVTGTGVQHISATGELLLDWRPFDHIAYTDVDTMILKASPINWTHGNAISLDTDGNLLISFRTLNEITKIDATTGEIIWRLGGKANQFTFTAPFGSPGFMGQHNVRALGNGRILLLDNIGSADTRMEQYHVDPVTHVATLEWYYSPSPPVQTLVGGSVHVPASGRYIVSVGTTGTVHEVGPGGGPKWQIDGNPGYVFRAQKFPSLYRPGIGAPR